MKNCPTLYAVDNRGVHGLEHLYGAPFPAKDFEQAKEMVKRSIEKEKELIDLENFFLVELLPYDPTMAFPLVFEDTSEVPDEICVADLFEEEENPADEVAYCGRYHGISSEQIGEESEVADEQE